MISLRHTGLELLDPLVTATLIEWVGIDQVAMRAKCLIVLVLILLTRLSRVDHFGIVAGQSLAILIEEQLIVIT